MQKIIFSTCGTSILTYDADADLRRELNLNANIKNPREWQGNYDAINSFIKKIKAEFLTLAPNEVVRRSAELNALFAWYKSDLASLNKDLHFFIHSDTLLGKETANCIADYLKEHYSAYVHLVTATNLNTNSDTNFNEALKELTRRLRECIPSGSRQSAQIIFNLTGGFKGLNAYLQVVANLWADYTIILFETGKLLTIPRLPLLLDTTSIEENIVTARRLALGLKVIPSDIGSLPAIFYTELGGECLISDIGELVIKEALPQIYAKGLQPSPSPRLVYGPLFSKSIEHLERQRDRLVMLQERIDDCAKAIEIGINPDRLTFKPLEGKSQYSHEFYAWSDANAGRVYVNKEENGRYIIEILGPHS